MSSLDLFVKVRASMLVGQSIKDQEIFKSKDNCYIKRNCPPCIIYCGTKLYLQTMAFLDDATINN